MKTYLIITIGTRDVQLRRDRIEMSNNWNIVKTPNPKTGRDTISIGQDENDLPVFTNDDFPDYFTLSPRSGGYIVNENFKKFESILELPLIMPVLDSLSIQKKTIDRVMLIYTDQQTELEQKLIKPYHYI